VHLLEPLSSQRLVLWGLLDGLGCYHGIEYHRICPSIDTSTHPTMPVLPAADCLFKGIHFAGLELALYSCVVAISTGHDWYYFDARTRLRTCSHC